MTNVAAPNRSAKSPSDAASPEAAERKLRASRGLRTLEHDIAELKRLNKTAQSSKPARENGGPAVKRAPVPTPKQAIPQKPSASPAPEQRAVPTGVPQAEPTHYRAELERLAAKYIPEKKTEATIPTPPTKPQSAPPSSDALKSFEMNKAFNDQLHRAQTPKKPEEAPVEKVEKKEEVKPVEKTELPETQERQSEGEKKDNTLEPAEKKEPEKKFTDLTEEDITRELNRVLNTPKEEEEKRPEEAKREEAPATPEKKERPEPSLKQLEDTLSDLSQRITSSASRIDTYLDEEKEANASLKNLFERRDIIDKNLNPIREKERVILDEIRKLEEKEASASNKIEKRDAENRRWEQENERRELEDERWRLEEIYEKLRLVIEKTEYELHSTKKKLAEEREHKTELEAEKRAVETHRDLITKRDEKDRAEKARTEVQNQITNLKNELKVIRSTEEGFEKTKRELEAKIGALNEMNAKRSLEKERRTVEDELHETEKKRWSLEDELKKYYAEKDEKDRQINLLSTELSSLQSKFEELERAKSSEETKN